jgi:aminopeptidase N
MKKLFTLSITILIAISVYSQHIADSLWEASIDALKEKNYMQSVELLNAYSLMRPGSPEAYQNLAHAYWNLGDIESLCESIKKAKENGAKVNLKSMQYYCDDNYLLKYYQKKNYKGVELKEENGYRPLYSRRDTLRGTLRKERSSYDVTFYNLNVRIIPKSKSIKGYNEIYFDVLDSSLVIQLDLFENMQIDSIVYRNTLLNFDREFEAVWVYFENTIVPGDKVKITVYYHGKPRKAPDAPWDGGFVWDKEGGNHWVGVACEQLGASAWWPTKDHLSDRPDSMGINLEVPEDYQAISNGTLRNVINREDKYSRYEWFVHYPINNYNATFYMGKYAEFTDTIYTLGDTLIARYHVLPKNLERAKDYFKQSREVVDVFSRLFGPFPFPKDNFRMVESPYAGMEHQTAIAYGDGYGDDEGSREYIDADYDHIIVHEAAHEWWGNSITARDMADAWIHEGFATYAEYLFLEDRLGYQNSVKNLQTIMQYIANVWPMVQHYDVNEDSFISSDIYMKGATMLHCLRATVNNDSLFLAMVKNFYMQYRNSIVETKDYIAFSNEYLGKYYSPFYRKFLYELDAPVLSYSFKIQNNGVLFSYKWTDVPEGFEMAFGIGASNGENYRLVGTTEKQEFFIENARFFNFYNMVSNIDNAPHNSFTYYSTRMTTN